ncbi:hypothetical protein CXF68_16725 [Tenacibaculum sp. Bg11-29]|nr:hypothetical protein CXF68_16725 [Tenacibaculum sp. Bg11-29]
MDDYMLPCLNKKFFGVDCLGCGTQRALSLLIHGEFIAAFKMYPAIYTLLFLAVIIVLNLFYKIKYAQKIISILAVINVLIIVVSYLIKMNQLI